MGPSSSDSWASGPNPESSDPSGTRTQVPTRPTPQGLGRKFRLARPLRASDADTASPDPLGFGRKSRLARPLQGSGAGRRSPGSARLPTHGARTHDVTGAVTPIPQQGRVTTIPTTLGTAALPLSLCDLTTFIVVYRLTVKRGWGKLISITICCLLPLLTR